MHFIFLNLKVVNETDNTISIISLLFQTGTIPQWFRPYYEPKMSLSNNCGFVIGDLKS